MAQENIQLVKDLYAAFGRRDIPAILSKIAPDFEVNQSVEVPWGGRYLGPDGLLQFFWFQTGDGIVPQEWVLTPEFRRTIPKQMDGYTTAYQQKGELWFLPLNLIHVPVALLSVVALAWLLRRASRAKDWRGATLPAFVLVALLGNAFICGVFSGPHFRYQSRIMWWPALVVILLGAEQVPALRRRFA